MPTLSYQIWIKCHRLRFSSSQRPICFVLWAVEEAIVEGENHWQRDAKPKAKRKKIPPHLPQRHGRRTSLMLVAKILCACCLHGRAGQAGGRTRTQGTGYLRSPPCHGSSPPPQKPPSVPHGRCSASTESQASARK